MPWLHVLADAVTPADAAQGSVVTYVLGFGPLGIAALALAWLAYKGWRLVSPDREAQIREAARSDLLRELEQASADADRLRAERDRNAEQRDEALRIARDQLAPLLYQFTAATGSLLPVLQQLVRQPPGGGQP